MTSKGRGIAAKRAFPMHSFICEYVGTRISTAEAIKASENSESTYRLYVTKGRKKLVIDAAEETGRYGRLINHSHIAPNAKTVCVEIDGQLRAAIVAVKDINIGEEILYDYGETRRSMIISNPWLKYT